MKLCCLVKSYCYCTLCNIKFCKDCLCKSPHVIKVKNTLDAYRWGRCHGEKLKWKDPQAISKEIVKEIQ